MKKITLSLTAILSLFLSVHAQQLENDEIKAFGDNFNIYNSTQNRLSTSEDSVRNYVSNSIYNPNIDSINRTQSLSLRQATNSEPVNENNDILSISLIDTNNLSTSSDPIIIRGNQYLVWSSNGADLNSTAPEITVNLSSDILSALTTNVSYTAMARSWKLEEFGGDMPIVNISIPQNSVISTSSLGKYYMFISDSESFDTTSDYKIMSPDGDGNLVTEYDFDDTTYITFGFTPQITEERSITFNGVTDYIDAGNNLNLNPSGFTISAWIKPNSTENRKATILSKRDMTFTEGYSFSLHNNKLRILWKNVSNQSLISNTSLPDNEWHHVAVTYDGSLVSIYIDGVLDNSAYRTAPIATNQSFLIAAAGKQSPVEYFQGNIDEVRIWNTDLTKDQLRYIMNQEIVENSGYVIGKELSVDITKNDISTIPWTALEGYYPMSLFTYKNVIDNSGNDNNGKLMGFNVDRETAPLPYKSIQNGDWDTHTSWSNGNVQYSPGSTSIVDSNITIDWNIVRTTHNLTMSNSALPDTKDYNRTLLGLFVDANELTLIGDTETLTGNGLTITHYLNLVGKIDLEGESQLIQTSKSGLEVSSTGKIERDQQGTADTYTYNYWSSPVSQENSGLSSFKITDVMRDGTNPDNPLPINFSSSGYDGAATNPIGIADYWIWKYANQPTQTYSAWQHLRRTGTIFPGEGFTMKGPGTGAIDTLQNYVFIGKPNNGDINLTLAPDNDYLVGNPYPSAIDANIFIRDNGPQLISDGTSDLSIAPSISGTIYFWNHWGGGSHVLQEYKGGYATYNFSGAVAAASIGSDDPDIGTGGEPAKRPERFIAVGQGFFVTGNNGGTINFNNAQRVFKRETNSSSVFMRGSTTGTQKDNNIDDRMKFRIGFNSINTIRRQLLLTIDENASPNVDWAYDAKLNESQIDDMFWIINDENYIIQASNEAQESTLYPIGIKTSTDGFNSITIDALENVPDAINIYIHDIELDYYHNLRTSDYEIFLNAGEYLNRFEITFNRNLLGIDDDIKNSLDIIYSNDAEKIVLVNPNHIKIQSIELYNLLGQSIHSIKNILEHKYSEYNVKHLSTGTYIINLHTADGSVLTKKVVVR